MENLFIALAITIMPIAVTALIIGYRLKNKQLEMRGSEPRLGPEVDVLRDELNDTRAQLAKMQERLDFTERLLEGGSASQEDTSA